MKNLERWCSRKHVILTVCVNKKNNLSPPQCTSVCIMWPSTWSWRPSFLWPSGRSCTPWIRTLRTTKTGYNLRVIQQQQWRQQQQGVKTMTTQSKPQWVLTSSLLACVFRGDGVARHLRRGRYWNLLQHIRQGQLDDDVQHPSWVPEALVFTHSTLLDSLIFNI